MRNLPPEPEEQVVSGKPLRKIPWEILRDLGIVSGERRVYWPEAPRLEPRYSERQPSEFEPPSEGFEAYRDWTPDADDVA